ncbi:MAG: DUF177 domain-containing protein [Eubacteriales bacterium]|nr:DUF177 domain-containing protein [Eubacteriales bacterium]
MLIDLHGVLQDDGKVIQMDVDTELTSFESISGVFPIVSKDPVSLRIQNMGDRELHISGMMELTLCVPCDRCLEDVRVPFALQFERDVDMKQTEEERQEILDEMSFIEGYHLDVDQLICSEILVSWPSKVLCREDCKGLCNTCGTNLNHGECSCTPTDLDPRMAQIQQIFNKFKEV